MTSVAVPTCSLLIPLQFFQHRPGPAIGFHSSEWHTLLAKLRLYLTWRCHGPEQRRRPDEGVGHEGIEGSMTLQSTADSSHTGIAQEHCSATHLLGTPLEVDVHIHKVPVSVFHQILVRDLQ